MRCEETIAFEAYDVAVGAGESCCSFFSLFCVVCLVDLFLCAVTGWEHPGCDASIHFCSFGRDRPVGTGCIFKQTKNANPPDASYRWQKLLVGKNCSRLTTSNNLLPKLALEPWRPSIP